MTRGAGLSAQSLRHARRMSGMLSVSHVGSMSVFQLASMASSSRKMPVRVTPAGGGARDCATRR